MKKILSLLVIVSLLSGTLLLGSCTAFRALTSQRETTAETTAAPTEPVVVEALNGKDVRALFRAFQTAFTTAKSMDVTTVTKVGTVGLPMTMRYDLKFDETSAYVLLDTGNSKTEVCFVDGTVYVEVDGEKYKSSDATVEDVLGEDAISNLLSSAFSILVDEYYDKLEDAKLYFFEDEYYYTVSFTGAEAEQMGFESLPFEETVYFNADGKVTRIVDRSVGNETTVTFRSYAEPVEIKAPADADTYKEKPMSGTEPDAGDQDPQTYALYLDMIDAMTEAEMLAMTVNVDGVPIIFYENDGKNRYVGAYSGAVISEIWAINGVGYVSVDGSTPVRTALTEELLSSFSSAESLLGMLTEEPYWGEEMTDLVAISDANGGILSFVIAYDDGYYDAFTYEYNNDMTEIHVNISQVMDGEIYETDYYIGIISDPNFILTPPV